MIFYSSGDIGIISGGILVSVTRRDKLYECSFYFKCNLFCICCCRSCLTTSMESEPNLNEVFAVPENLL